MALPSALPPGPRPHAAAPLTTEVHNDGGEPRPLRLDLSALRGQEAVIRLETHPGRAGRRRSIGRSSVSRGWWRRARRPGGSRPQPEKGRCRPRASRAAAGDRRRGRPLRIGCPCRERRGCCWRSTRDRASPRSDHCPAPGGAGGSQRHRAASLRLCPGGAGRGTVGGVTRRALSTHPPNHSRIVVDYILRLPETPARLEAQVGIRDGSASRGGLRRRSERRPALGGAPAPRPSLAAGAGGSVVSLARWLSSVWWPTRWVLRVRLGRVGRAKDRGAVGTGGGAPNAWRNHGADAAATLLAGRQGGPGDRRCWRPRLGDVPGAGPGGRPGGSGLAQPGSLPAPGGRWAPRIRRGH